MDSEDLRLAVYDRFRRGHIPRIDDLVEELGVTADEVGAGLAALAAQRHLALGDDGEITMAHPFSAVPLGFSVMGQDTLWWDAVAARRRVVRRTTRPRLHQARAERCGRLSAQCGTSGAFWGLPD